MRTSITALRDAMLEDVFRIFQDGPVTLETIDVAFHCCRDYWERARLVFERDPWRCEAEEIYFFKDAKPLFTGMMEYMVMRYQSMILLPRRLSLHTQFWLDEHRLAEKFRHHHGDFCRYYHARNAHYDHHWFVRFGGTGLDKIHPRIYNQDLEYSSPKDWESAMLIAYELYEEFVQSQLMAASCLAPLPLY